MFMLISSSFCIVTGQKQVAQNLDEANTAYSQTTSYSSDTTANDSSVRQQEDETLTEETTTPDVMEDLPAKINLSFSEAPVFNHESILSLILEPEIDAPNTEVRIILPEGFSLSAGSLKWTGDLQKNQIMQMNVSISTEKVGNWCIETTVISRPAYGFPKVYSTQCYVQVTETEAHVFDAAPEDFTKAEAIKLNSSESTRYVSGSTGNLTVYGTWYYQDQRGRLKPVRYAMVQLWAEGESSNIYLATTYVQSDGHYEFPAIASNNGSLTDGYNIYVKLFCDSYQYDIVKVMVSSNDPRKPSAICWSQTDVRYNVTDGHYDMGRWLVTGNKRECWAIYDGVVDGYFWLLNKVGWHRSKVLATAQSKGGESLSTGNGMIFNLGDGWDRDCVLHEYAHCIHYAARGGSFPPKVVLNEHYPDSETDGGWAITEGWAEFFPCAVDNTTLMWGVNFNFGSIESTTYANGIFGHGDSGDWDGDVVEGAVAQVFWDIFDGASPSDHPWEDEPFGDYVSNEFEKLWSIFLNYDPDNIHEFWAQWNPKDVSIWAIFNHARIIEPRNIAVTDVLSSQQSVILGETVYVNITVKNQGDTIENFDVTISVDDLVINPFENVTLESGNSQTFVAEWNTTGNAKGDHELSALAFVFPSDLNVTDDFDACVVTVLSCGHDVGVTNVIPSKTVIGQGYSLNIVIEAKNYGIFPETVDVTVSVNSTIFRVFANISLESAGSITLALGWDTTSCSKGNYTISAFIAPLEGEVDPSDNTFTIGIVKVTIPGDVNGDFLVNYSDVDLIRLYWQQRSPSIPTNIDIDDNGVVNIKDAALIALNWLKHA
jgi:hypothetical protein